MFGVGRYQKQTKPKKIMGSKIGGLPPNGDLQNSNF